MPRRILKHAQDNPRLWQAIGVVSAIAAAVIVAFVVITPMKPKEIDGPSVAITGKQIAKLSDETVKDIDVIMEKEQLIVATSVVQASLAKNTRKTIFFKSKISQMQRVWDDYSVNRVSPPALFSSAPVQNDRIAQLINGNLDCRQFSVTLGYLYYPDMNSFGPWVCSISVPPGFDGSGDFNGFLTFHTSREPSDTEKLRIAKHAVEISTSIFKRDVK